MQSFAIIPAAGRSRRMGRPKLLLPWGDSTVIEHVVGTWRASQVQCVVIVVHPLDKEIAELARRAGAVVVVPETPPAEMKISVGLGLRWVESQFASAATDAWLLAPADMPLVSTATIDALLAAHQKTVESSSPPRIWAPIAGGRRGHPVLFPWSLVSDVDRLSPSEGIDAIVARNAVETIAMVDPSLLDDLDTPQDYERMRDGNP